MLTDTVKSCRERYSKETEESSRKTKMKKLLRKKKPQRTDSTRLLTENNNIFLQEGCDQAGNVDEIPSNTINNNNNNNNEEKPLQIAEQIAPQELAEVLEVDPDVNPSVDGVCCSIQPEVTSEWQRSSVRLIRRSVYQHFPKQPADLDRKLHEHLENVQNTVHSKVVKLRPLLDHMGLAECLIDSYHRKTFAHLHDLLQSISSTQSSLVLINWVLHSYLSPDLLDHPDLQDTLKKLDFVLLSEWMVKAKSRLLENVQKDVRTCLENILQNQRTPEGQGQDEAYVSLYVDTIECIEAGPKGAQKISPVLSVPVQEVCFTELLVFLDRYTAEQTEALGKEAKEDAPEMWHFFKTLKTCEELKKHVLSKGSTLKRSLLEELQLKLDNMETLTLNLQMTIVVDKAEKELKPYFKTNHNRLLFLISALRSTFPKVNDQETQKKVLDQAYKLIIQVYLKHLLRSSLKKLQRCWSPNVSQAVYDDAKILHKAMTELAPGVQEGNRMLLEVVKMLDCTDIDALKLTVATMEQCQTQSEDVDLLPKLLRWKGLPGWQVREVLDVIPGRQPRPVSCFSWLTCLINTN